MAMISVKMLKNLALGMTVSLTTLLLALGTGELAVRLLEPQQLIVKRPELWQPHDSLGYTHRPNVRLSVNTGERTVTVITDDNGYRTAADDSTGTPEFRILLLGDSFMEALQVEYRQSFAGLLDAYLSEDTGRTVEVDNASVGGWGPSQYLIEARRALDRRTYDLVLVALYTGNDILEWREDRIPPRVPIEVHEFSVPDRLAWQAIVNDLLYPLNDFLEVRSHLFVLAKRQAGLLRAKLGLTAAYFPEVYWEKEANSRRWQITADVCRDIAELAASHGSASLFLLIPERGQVSEEAFRHHVESFGIDTTKVNRFQPNQRLARQFRQMGLKLIDPLEGFRQASKADPNIYGDVDTHFSPTGHKVLLGLTLDQVQSALMGPTELSGTSRQEEIRASSQAATTDE